jgi:histidyl-tRNA synthetase
MPAPQPARGTRDFLPADLRRREYVIATVREVYERYGFEPLETPAFENIETLLGKYGEEGNKLIFKILKRGEDEKSGAADLALRYDLTVPLARVVALHQHELPKYFRRYQIQPVWRADRPARGRFREFYQCDVDALGTVSPIAEVEVIAAVSEALQRLGFDDFIVRLNDRRLLTTLLELAGVPPALAGEALVALDKLDKIGRDGVRAELLDRGVDAAAADHCLASFAAAADGPADTLARLSTTLGARADVLNTLRTILELSAHTAAANRLRVDPSLARGLSYYTGAIMEVAVPDLAGSLGGGGRYDHLIGMFLGRDVPACGFSLGLERIVVVMTERGMFPPSVGAAPAAVLVALWSEALRGDAVALAAELRRGGIAADLFPEADKPGRQFKYAAARQYPLVALVGEDEQRAGTVAIKDLRTGAQQAVPRDRAVEFIKTLQPSGPPAAAGAVDR